MTWTPDPSIIITAEQKQSEALEQAWSSLRTERDRLLAETDWTQVSDAPVDAAPWAAYRQALRDLPESTTDPNEPQWPEEPQNG